MISQAAEAKIYRDNDKIIKERIKKSYRIPEIDERLRKSRTKTEYNLILRAKRIGVNVPKPIEKTKYNITMSFIGGKRLRNSINKLKLDSICNQVGEQLAALHRNDIIHGDLTTSNMILSGEKVFFIDFGLGFISKRIESKANDLHLLKQALESKHPEIAKEVFEGILESYKLEYSESKEVLNRLRIVENRRRYTE